MDKQLSEKLNPSEVQAIVDEHVPGIAKGLEESVSRSLALVRKFTKEVMVDWALGKWDHQDGKIMFDYAKEIHEKYPEISVEAVMRLLMATAKRSPEVATVSIGGQQYAVSPVVADAGARKIQNHGLYGKFGPAVVPPLFNINQHIGRMGGSFKLNDFATMEGQPVPLIGGKSSASMFLAQQIESRRAAKAIIVANPPSDRMLAIKHLGMMVDKHRTAPNRSMGEFPIRSDLTPIWDKRSYQKAMDAINRPFEFPPEFTEAVERLTRDAQERKALQAVLEWEQDPYVSFHRSRVEGRATLGMTLYTATKGGWFFAGTWINTLYFAMGYSAPTIN